MNAFLDNFSRGYGVWKEVSVEVLRIEPDLGGLLCELFQSLYTEAKFKIFESLYPKDSDWRRYFDRLSKLSPWEIENHLPDPPESPAKRFEEARLPEPIFTNIRKTSEGSIVVSIVFGGILKPNTHA